MENYKNFYAEALNELDYLNELIDKQSPVDLQYFHLQTSVQKFLKSLLSFYGVETDLEYIDQLIELLEEKTTIKLPERDTFFELSFIPYESGCASQIIYEKLPVDFIEHVNILHNFIKDEIGENNLTG